MLASTTNNPVKDMISALHQGKTSVALEAFQAAMITKVNAALDERKIAIAASVYSPSSK